MPKELNITTKSIAGEITTITFKKPVYSVLIENRSEKYALYVSFNMGEDWIKIPCGFGYYDLFASMGKPIILLKSDGESQPVRIVYRLVEGGR